MKDGVEETSSGVGRTEVESGGRTEFKSRTPFGRMKVWTVPGDGVRDKGRVAWDTGVPGQ